MKDRLKFFGQMGLFWLIWFVICRIIFLVYHADQTFSLTAKEIFTVLLLGIRMDLAMSAYWLIITGLLMALPFSKPLLVYYIHAGFTVILLIICTALVVIDLELYSHWGFRLNTTPLFYLSKEAAGSVNSSRLVVLILLFIVILGVSLYLYFKFLSKKILKLQPLPFRWTPVMLLITACLFIPIRSRFSVAPLNTGVVYFHKTKSFPNHAGINVVWNFFNSLSAKDNLKYPSNFYSGNASGVLHQMEKSQPFAGSLLHINHPNIILIILESFTANIIEPLGGLKGITPNFNALVPEGILFDHFYASGDRTDKGLVAVLSGYPAQPQTSIIRFPHKTQNLPFLPRCLQREGYHTSFIYGGDVGFANMESYLITGGFSHITRDNDFSATLNNSKWGVADHFVFNRMVEECDTARIPFFKVMLSLSSHEPFEVPMDPVFPGKDEPALFLNACLYTDKSLGDFIREAKQKPWWRNTLVIITADHGHRYPNAAELKENERFKIPMLWLGGAIAKRDTVIHTLGGQTDLANTLLAQLDTSRRNFQFSKNILAPDVKPYAIYIFQNGFGYLDPENEYVYDFDFRKFSNQKGSDDAKEFGKAYMQVLFDDYNSR
jgi:phosphoglycerol transferase MdoB-like AlkP superfamily enzyme